MEYSDITIAQYQELCKVKAEGIDGDIQSLSILTGKSIEELETLDLKELKKLLSHLKPLERLSIDTRGKKYITCGGVKFKVAYDISRINGGEYRGLMTVCKTKEAIDENLHTILSVFVKPVRRWYQLRKPDIDVPAHLKQHLKLDVAYPLALFFCNLSENLMPVIKTYLGQQLRQTEKIPLAG